MKTLANLFWNRSERRLRLTWRLILQSLLMGALLLILQAITSVIFSTLYPSDQLPSALSDIYWSAPLQELIAILASGIAVSVSVYLSARILDRRQFKDLGFILTPNWWTDFFFGLLLGAFLMLLVFLTELLLGWIKIQGSFQPSLGNPTCLGSLLISLIIFIAVGFYEELYSRGYLIKNLSESLSGKLIPPRLAITIACLLTSIYFGLLHAANPNSTKLAIINIGLAGILLSSGYLITGQLALSIGLHISWNFFQGTIFGFPVSGSSGLTDSIFKIDQFGPVLWTGGKFGPEGGLLGSLISILGLGIIIFYKGKKARLHIGLSRFHPKSHQTKHHASITLSKAEQRIPIKHIIWDWNGTLLDDLGLCLDIINNMLAARKLPGISRDSYLEVFDFPVEEYYQKIGFDFSKEPFESISNEFINAYEKDRPNCNLMLGAREILSHVSSLGISQSIISASKGSYLVKAIAEYEIKDYFDSVQGLDNHHAAGKLALAKKFLYSCDLEPSDLLLVGDTTHDGSIAAELGINCVLIPNGHQNRQRLEKTNFPIVRSLPDLQNLIS